MALHIYNFLFIRRDLTFKKLQVGLDDKGITNAPFPLPSANMFDVPDNLTAFVKSEFATKGGIAGGSNTGHRTFFPAEDGVIVRLLSDTEFGALPDEGRF